MFSNRRGTIPRVRALPLDETLATLIGLGLARVGDEYHAVKTVDAGHAELSHTATSPAVRLIDGFGEFVAPSGTPVLSTEALLRIVDEY